MTRSPVATVEAAWDSMLLAAGWTDTLNCSPNLSALRAYYARVDALTARRATALRALIASARSRDLTSFQAAYLDRVEATIEQAITNPRKV